MQAAIAAAHGFAHAGEVVVFGIRSSTACLAVAADLFSTFVSAPFIAANDESSVVGFFHVAVLPDDHGGDGVGSLDMGNVETLYAARLFGKVESVLQGFADGLRAWFHYTEALFERVLRVAFYKVQEGAFVAALWCEDFDLVSGALGERFFEQFAVFEIDGDVNRFGQIFGFQVELLKERRDEFLRIELVEIFPI